MRLILSALIATGIAYGQTVPQIAFSPQGGSHTIKLWAVSGCPGKPVSIAQIYRIATQHQISWVLPGNAADLLAQRTFLGNVVRWGGLATGITQGLLEWKVITANAGWTNAATGASMFLNVALPIATRNAPALNPGAGQDLAVGTSGCGSTLFYALPSKVGPFVEAVQ